MSMVSSSSGHRCVKYAVHRAGQDKVESSTGILVFLLMRREKDAGVETRQRQNELENR